MFQTEYLSGKQSLWIVNNGINQSPLRKGNTEIETFFSLSDQEKGLPIFVIIKNKLQAPSLSSVLIKLSFCCLSVSHLVHLNVAFLCLSLLK